MDWAVSKGYFHNTLNHSEVPPPTTCDTLAYQVVGSRCLPATPYNHMQGGDTRRRQGATRVRTRKAITQSMRVRGWDAVTCQSPPLPQAQQVSLCGFLAANPHPTRVPTAIALITPTLRGGCCRNLGKIGKEYANTTTYNLCKQG